MTCKFFLLKYHLRHPWSGRLKNYKLWNFGTIWLTNRLEMKNVAATFYQSFISKINGCDLTCLIIENSKNLTFDEFKFFTESGKVTLLYLNDTKIIYPDNTVVPVEDIMGCALSARSISLQPCHVTSQTMTKLCSTVRKNTLANFKLKQVDGHLDLKLLDQFLKKNIDKKFEKYATTITFADNIN